MLTNWPEEALQDLREWAMAKGLDLEGKLANAAAELRDAWNTSSKDPAAFYRSDQAATYIFDLTAWHANSPELRRWFDRVYSLVQNQLKRGDVVLDYGAGIGSYSLMIASMGVNVVACELNPKLREYIYWRACRRNLDQLIHIVEEPPANQKYAAIVCLDTIEHLPQPERFPGFARQLLVPGGYLVATWTFHQSGGMHPMHAEERQLAPFLDALKIEFELLLDQGWPACFRSKS